MTLDREILLLTRPAESAEEFLSLCEARSGRTLTAIISPIMRIEPVGDLPDIKDYETLILTSRASVDVLGDLLQGRKVITVGAKTAALARASGAEVLFTAPDVETLLNRFPKFELPGLHLRGEFAHGDLASNLTAAGFHTDERIIYRQPAEPLTEKAREAIRSNKRLIAPLFSARSARLLAEQVPMQNSVHAVAISEAVRDAWPFSPCVVAETPTAQAMCAATLEALSL